MRRQLLLVALFVGAGLAQPAQETICVKRMSLAPFMAQVEWVREVLDLPTYPPARSVS